ncbi:hypothetical protein [Bacillus cereus]|uniref:hypothetical protein n=1 Tax=Bacillus cereus TaxID=1396 RepID=UPI001642863A|nr:hypothetical protein [Bacillus cereus]
MRVKEIKIGKRKAFPLLGIGVLKNIKLMNVRLTTLPSRWFKLEGGTFGCFIFMKK